MNMFSTPSFGLLITIIAFEIGVFIYKKGKIPIFNPILISVILIILFLVTFKIDIKDYNKGGDIISFFLGPCTVILAVPLYRQIKELKKNGVAVITGIVTGSLIAMTSVVFMSKMMGIDKNVILSLIPKSVTTPIGIEVSRQLGGNISITVAAIVITGILGAVFGPLICKLFRIENKIAIGVALGTATHAVGTSKAVEMGEVEGAMSGLSIGIAGLTTVLLAPVMILLV